MPPARPGGKKEDEVDEATGSTGRSDEMEQSHRLDGGGKESIVFTV